MHGSSNIVGATHAHYTQFPKPYGLYPSQDVMQVVTLLVVDASVCTPLLALTQQLPTVSIVGPTELGVVASICT